MSRSTRITAMLLMAMLPLSCTTVPTEQSASGYPETVFEGIDGIWVPIHPRDRTGAAPRLPAANQLAYKAVGPYPIALDQLPPQVASGPDLDQMQLKTDPGRIEKPISEEAAARLRQQALSLPPNALIQRARVAGPASQGPAISGDGFDSLDFINSVPPDPELAVGPNHIIAAVNSAFEIYDKSGNVLQTQTSFSSFFTGVSDCSSNPFDPNVLYDEEFDRFIIAVDGAGTNYCIAVTTGSDPMLGWNAYAFATDVGGNFFDYPHAGVGVDAIYMGANMFAGSFAEGRVWAIDKIAMYDGDPAPSVVTHSTGGQSTPQPMNLHGLAQGTWPSTGPHYILTDGPFNGANYGVWEWSDPFGANSLSDKGTVDLSNFTDVPAGMPIDAPQSGSSVKLDGNDWRVQDAEYRNGFIWMADTIACNPGGGTVDCVRWAQIDPTVPDIVDAGVYASDGDYRIFADLAVNHCNDMAVGYTKTSSSSWPSIYVTGRKSDDPPGALQDEVLMKAGDSAYRSFQNGTTHRWGDYTGMTIDPDGKTFWYLGEYAKNIGGSTNWGTFIRSFSFASCTGVAPTTAPGMATSPNPAHVATSVDANTSLDWSAGVDTFTHDVYFGTESTPGFQRNQSGSFFNPGTLEFSTTYFWRVDEVNTIGTTTGSVWSFTTGAQPPAVHVADLAGSALAGSRGRWTAEVQISVVDASDTPIAGVLAEGGWSDGANGSGSCTTDGSGQCPVLKSNVKKNVNSATFSMNKLSATGFIYDADANAVSSIVVNKSDVDLLPNAVDDNFSTTLDTALVDANVLANDDQGNAPATVTIDAGPGNGALTMASDGVFTYTPDTGFLGDDSFAYTITDTDGDTSSAIVTVTVGDSGPPPGELTVTASPFKVKGVQHVDLTWSGFTSTNVTIRRDGMDVETTTANDGEFTEYIGVKGGGVTYTYEVCEAGTSTCASDTAIF